MLTLTATDLPRFIACNGSIKVEPFVSNLENDDTGKKEGDAAHWLIEQVHKYGQPLEAMLNKQAPNGVFINADMVENVTPYLDDIKGIGQVEFDTSFQDVEGLWRIGGRADHVFQGQGSLVIRDFKYGWRLVEAELNYTLIWHAVGFLLRAKSMGISFPATQLSVVEFIVYQPRPYHPKGNIRKWTIPRGTLEDIWHRIEAVLDSPSDTLHTGSQCYKCPGQTNCPAFNRALNNSVDVSETAFTDQISNVDLARQLDITSRALEVLKQANDAYEEVAKHRIKLGQIIPNHTIERSMGKTEWKANITPEFMQMMTGRDLTRKELVTPTQAKKMGVPEAVVESLTERNVRGINLVRVDADTVAQKMFKQKAK